MMGPYEEPDHMVCTLINHRKGERDMNLELTDREQKALVEVLKDYIPELRGEIASGVKHDLKEELKSEESTLKAILQKLQA